MRLELDVAMDELGDRLESEVRTYASLQNARNGSCSNEWPDGKGRTKTGSETEISGRILNLLMPDPGFPL